MMIDFNMKRHFKNGQGIIEYLILVTAVIVALMLFFSRGSSFERSYDGVIEKQGDMMRDDARRMFR